MLKIRLTRIGKKVQPSFRIVVAEHSRPVKGKFIEVLGFYRPTTKEITLKKDRIEYWIANGAQPSNAVAALLKKENWEGMDKYLDPREKKRKKKSEAKAEAKAAASGVKKEEPKVEAKPEEKAEEVKAEEPKEEAKPEEKAEEVKAEEPKEEAKPEEKAEEVKADEPKEEKKEENS